MNKITVAGGCFWGVEAYFKRVEGITDTTVGYIDGEKAHPTYDEVCAGIGHAEAVELVYDSDKLSLDALLDHYFNIVDPTLFNRQGPDIGKQYRSGLYYHDQADKPIIENKLKTIAKNYQRPLRVDLKSAPPFYEAEDYHQDYLDKNINGYCHINLKSVKNIK